MVVPLYGQTVGNMGGITHTNDGTFMYRVKLIDEFIERFNDEPQSYIRQQAKALTGTDSMLNRRRMLRALLYKGTTWTIDTAKFIDAVCQPANEQWLHFDDTGWYAVANCTFTRGGKEITIPLTLRVHTYNEASWWKIAGVGNTNLPSTGCPAYVPTAARGRFIPASAHGTNYVVLSQLLQPGMSMEDVMDTDAINSGNGRLLARWLQGGALQFAYVSSIQYHFFQVPGWYFTVAHHKGSGTQSGWLISSLKAVTEQEKTQLQNLLLAH
jgi:hypothetical protein